MLATNNEAQDAPKRGNSRSAHSHRPISEVPKTPGDRMAQRRKELGLRQEDVAKQVRSRRKDGTTVSMSRSGYCMYEQDSVAHEVKKIALIAQVLQTTPEWLAYGVSDRDSVEQVEFNDGRFEVVRKCRLDDEWLYTSFEVEPSELALWVATNACVSIEIDDIAVVRKNTRPGSHPAEFVYEEGGKARIGLISRPLRNGAYILTSKDGKARSREIKKRSISFLGRVVGRFGPTS